MVRTEEEEKDPSHRNWWLDRESIKGGLVGWKIKMR